MSNDKITAQERIDKLKVELNSLQAEQVRCSHKFDSPYQDYRVESEFEYKYVCGKIEETEKTELVVVGTRPVFK